MPPLWKKTRRSPRSGNRRSRARRRPSRSRQRQMARSASGVRTTTWSIAGASAAAASAGRAPSCTARPWKASGQLAGQPDGLDTEEERVRGGRLVQVRDADLDAVELHAEALPHLAPEG